MQKRKEPIGVLLVEDDELVRNTICLLLDQSGYKVRVANNGFEALQRLQEELPNVLITDLNMPEMSGFELLSVVRRRFPTVIAIATSAAYTGSSVPTGVVADAFYAKGSESSSTMLEILDAAIKKGALDHDGSTAPVWIPRNGRDHDGHPYVVLTCTDCLRSFPFSVVPEPTAEILKTPCIYCPHEVSYIIDFSRSVNSPQRRAQWRAKFLQEQGPLASALDKKRPEPAREPRRFGSL